jgi:5'-methylthioadenosine phosphorylase
MIAVIGGPGIHELEMLEDVKDFSVETEYGTVPLQSGVYKGKKIFLLERHGEDHSIPPHMVNYRANIKALRDLKVERIISTSAVGSLKETVKPGDFVLLDQFFDFTYLRKSTFFDKGIVHADVTEPYCPQLQEVIMKAASAVGIDLYPKGIYVCTEGPRFQTLVEIKRFVSLGGDVIGMTNVPEVVLAREANICFASIATATNYAAGVSQTHIPHEKVNEIMNENSKKMKNLLFRAIEMVPEGRTCECGDKVTAWDF